MMNITPQPVEQPSAAYLPRMPYGASGGDCGVHHRRHHPGIVIGALER